MLCFAPRENQQKVPALGLHYLLKTAELDKLLFSSNFMESSDWINDLALEKDLRDYVRRNPKEKIVFVFLKRDYEQSTVRVQ